MKTIRDNNAKPLILSFRRDLPDFIGVPELYCDLNKLYY